LLEKSKERLLLKVLAVNWRDIKHPEAGGAEVHLHEILAHFVKWGHGVTQISSGFPGGEPETEVDGIRILRYGHWFDANFALPFFARRQIKLNPYDIVMEDINKLPFFMPLYTDVPVLGVIPHLFGTTVFREANWIIGSYVVMMEKLIPYIYKNNRFMVISPSTKDDLAARGIGTDRIKVVLCGLNHELYRDLDLERFKDPTIVHLGRLRKYKSVEVAIRAIKIIRDKLPKARLVIIGDGPYRLTLEGLVEKLGVKDAVEFKGYMKAEELVRYLNKAHLLINPSPKEGWGLTVVEANACGMPVVASDRPGLRDSVWVGETGVLVPYGDEAAFAEKSMELLEDRDLWYRMSKSALKRVKELTWERCARETESLVSKIVGV
jgi:glycosyltransferase involved in cell wall biosynthesis